jgi:hypothetical protein
VFIGVPSGFSTAFIRGFQSSSSTFNPPSAANLPCYLSVKIVREKKFRKNRRPMENSAF